MHCPREGLKRGAGNKNLIAWVKVPTLSAAQDTVIYMYYGNASATAKCRNSRRRWRRRSRGPFRAPPGRSERPASASGDRGSTLRRPTPVRKRETIGRETRKPAKPARLAQIRIRSLLFDGMRSRTSKPARGVNSMMLSKCWSIGLPHDVISEHHQNPAHHEERVRLQPSAM